MSGRSFLDTNVFVYTFDASQPTKRRIARSLVREALQDRSGVISFQVVQEFLNVALQKFQHPLSGHECARYLARVFEPLCEVFPTLELHGNAIEIHERWQVPYYDALIVAAAQSAGCKRIRSEDFQHGQRIGDVLIENPFRTSSAR